MDKAGRDSTLITLYQEWIQPKVNSPHFPKLSHEDILKMEAKKSYKTLFWSEKAKGTFNASEFEKAHGKPPESLISRNGWFLVSDAKEKDVSNIHFSFGFEETGDDYWAEIALNSVASVEQFLSMNDAEVKQFFALCKSKPEHMVLNLNKKIKTNFAGSVRHEPIFSKKMRELTENDIKMVRVRANEINNIRDPLIKPYIGLCMTHHVKKEELAKYITQMIDIFEFIKNLTPRQTRYKNTLREEHQLTKRKEEIESEINDKKKKVEFLKNLGMHSDQEKLEADIKRLEKEAQQIEGVAEERKKAISDLEKDMGKSK